MDDEILEIIKKQLPAQVGQVLRERLRRADELEVALKSTEKVLVETRATRDEFQAKDTLYHKLNAREEDLNKLDAQLDDRSRNMVIEVLQTKLDCAEDKAKAFHDFTTGLMRNIEYRSSAFGNTTRTDDHGVMRSDPYDHNTTGKVE